MIRLNPDTLPPVGDPAASSALEEAWHVSKMKRRSSIEAITFLTRPDTPAQVFIEAWTMAPRCIHRIAARNPDLPDALFREIRDGDKIRAATSFHELARLSDCHISHLALYLHDIEGLDDDLRAATYWLHRRKFNGTYSQGLPAGGFVETLEQNLVATLEHPDCPAAIHWWYLERHPTTVLDHCSPYVLSMAMRKENGIGLEARKAYAERGDDPDLLKQLYNEDYASVLANPNTPQKLLDEAFEAGTHLSWLLLNPKLDFSKLSALHIQNWEATLARNPATPTAVLWEIWNTTYTIPEHLAIRSPNSSALLRHPNTTPELFARVCEEIDDPLRETYTLVRDAVRPLVPDLPETLKLSDTIIGAAISVLTQKSMLGLLGNLSENRGLQLAGDLAIADAVEKAIKKA